MDTNQTPSVRLALYAPNPIEAKDEQDEKFERCYGIVKNIFNGVSEKEAHDMLNVTVCKGPQQHEETSVGLIMIVLTEPTNASRCYRDLTFITRDGLALVINITTQIILEKYIRLGEIARQQLLWFIKEMIRNSVAGADGLCYNLLRQIAGGDVSSRNVWLVESVLDLLTTNKPWLEKFPILIATVVYTYLRLIVDHGCQVLSALRQREVTLCVNLLRENFSECMVIGRDLVRLLQNNARIPEFEKLWRDMIMNPSNLHSSYTGILQLMTTRTPRKFLQCRLTPDMEKKIHFLTSQVKFGMQKRYQDWFQKQYLSMPESQSLRCDLIRYICCVIHPSNEVLCSDIIPRWAVIGWLLTTCTSNVAASNAKLSLFYDWLLYDSEKDNIMNIEPAILVMHHSMRPHPAITATLLDFLCRIIPNFSPSLTSVVKSGIFRALKHILDKRVLPSLSPLFNNSKLDKELRLMVRETFTEFCHLEVREDNSFREIQELPDSSHLMNNGSDEAQFSEDEDDIPLGVVIARKLKHKDKFKPIDESSKSEENEICQCISQLSHNIKKAIVAMQNEADNEIRCEIMEKLLLAILQEEDFDQETAALIATCLNFLLKNQFVEKVFPETVDEATIEDSIGAPLFVMFRNLCQTPEDDPSRQPLLLILAEMSGKRSKIGFLLLYFYKASDLNRNKMSAYRDYCKMLDSHCDLATCLINDLTLCQQDDVGMFCYLIPEIYNQFTSTAIGNSELVNLIVCCIDSTQLQELVCQILQGNMIMFRKDSLLSILNASLEWETFEQYCLWQLIAAHNIPVDQVMPVLPKIEFSAHAEAMTSILIMLKQEKPTEQLMKHLMAREPKRNDYFVVSVLKFWTVEHENKVTELITNCLSKLCPTPSKRKRPAASKSINYSSLEQTLTHLDHLRLGCKQMSIFEHDSIQGALSQVQSSINDSLKTKFSDLFALAEEVEDVKTSRGRGRKGAKTTAKTKSNAVPDTDSSPTTSEDEEKVKPKPKKRKKAAPVFCDSD